MPLQPPDVAAPVPPRRAHALGRSDGTVVDDPWYWLREREDPAVRAHLEAENAHTERLFAPLESLVDTLFTGIKGRIIETDASVPVLDDGWLYYRRTVEGQQYAIQCRRPAPAGGGGTTFPDAKLEVAPQRGNAVFFSYERPDPSTGTLHGGAPVTDGEKWVATKWLRERVFT